MTPEFIETRIIDAVWKLLLGRVNKLLCDMEFSIPTIESGKCGGNSVIPVITLSTCEKTEKERLIRIDAYTLTINFSLQEHHDAEWYCYGYACAFEKALGENVTLGGVADRAVITGKKYITPKKQNCGEGLGLIITLRVTVEGMAA